MYLCRPIFWILKKLKDFDIAFDSLSIGEHLFKFEIGKELFEFFEHWDFNEVHIEGSLLLQKEKSYMNMYFEASGEVLVDCDRCGQPLKMPIEAEEKVIVKFSSKVVDSRSEEIVYLATSESILNVANYFYEMIVLSLPLKKNHDEADCNPEVIAFLNQWSKKEEEKEIDPRWEALKKLKQ